MTRRELERLISESECLTWQMNRNNHPLTCSSQKHCTDLKMLRNSEKLPEMSFEQLRFNFPEEFELIYSRNMNLLGHYCHVCYDFLRFTISEHEIIFKKAILYIRGINPRDWEWYHVRRDSAEIEIQWKDVEKNASKYTARHRLFFEGKTTDVTNYMAPWTNIDEI